MVAKKSVAEFVDEVEGKEGETGTFSEDTFGQYNDTAEVLEQMGEDSLDNDAEEETLEEGLEEKLAKAIAEKDDYMDKMLRQAADLENYKKRMIRERDSALAYASENLIKDLLPTIDNLGRALEHQPGEDVSVFVEGVEMTMKGLLATLEKAGLKAISSVGESFDPNRHEAMVMEASEEVPEQVIIKEFEKGYYYKDRLIRAAKVVVSKGDV